MVEAHPRELEEVSLGLAQLLESVSAHRRLDRLHLPRFGEGSGCELQHGGENSQRERQEVEGDDRLHRSRPRQEGAEADLDDIIQFGFVPELGEHDVHVLRLLPVQNGHLRGVR